MKQLSGHESRTSAFHVYLPFGHRSLKRGPTTDYPVRLFARCSSYAPVERPGSKSFRGVILDTPFQPPPGNRLTSSPPAWRLLAPYSNVIIRPSVSSDFLGECSRSEARIHQGFNAADQLPLFPLCTIPVSHHRIVLRLICISACPPHKLGLPGPSFLEERTRSTYIMGM